MRSTVEMQDCPAPLAREAAQVTQAWQVCADLPESARHRRLLPLHTVSWPVGINGSSSKRVCRAPLTPPTQQNKMRGQLLWVP